MSDRHELLCEQYYGGGGYYCICDEIAQSRAAEQTRILAVLDGMWRDDASVYSHAARLVIADLRAAIEASDE